MNPSGSKSILLKIKFIGLLVVVTIVLTNAQKILIKFFKGALVNIKGTRTEKNVMAAIIGEALARNRYTFAASIAKKEGYQYLSKIFEETAGHETEHANRLAEFLEDGEVEISDKYPMNLIGTTIKNLRNAIDGEHYEHSSMYPTYSKEAESEGFEELSKIFSAIAAAEKYHEKRFRKFLEEIENKTIFKKETEVTWKCTNCGHLHKGKSAPEKCPSCDHDQGYFKVLYGQCL